MARWTQQPPPLFQDVKTAPAGSFVVYRVEWLVHDIGLKPGVAKIWAFVFCLGTLGKVRCAHIMLL